MKKEVQPTKHLYTCNQQDECTSVDKIDPRLLATDTDRFYFIHFFHSFNQVSK